MIRLTKGETQSVYLTLTEKATLNNPYWLFEFISKDTGNKTYVLADDFSGNTARFNSFTFSEGSTATASGGFTLDAGTYDYQVWETQYQSFDTASASNIVEIGLMTIVGTVSNYTPEYDDTDDNEEYIYTG